MSKALFWARKDSETFSGVHPSACFFYNPRLQCIQNVQLHVSVLETYRFQRANRPPCLGLGNVSNGLVQEQLYIYCEDVLQVYYTKFYFT